MRIKPGDILYLSHTWQKIERHTCLLAISIQHKLQVTFPQTLQLKITTLKFTIIKIFKKRKKIRVSSHWRQKDQTNLLVIILSCLTDRNFKIQFLNIQV